MSYDVKELQMLLNGAGFGPLDVDGVKGPNTDKAVVAFKESIGFWGRPYVGPPTMAALRKAQNSTLPWMAEAIKMKGLHEARDVGQLRKWFDKSVSWIDPREIPWCGAFVATCHRLADPDSILPNNPLGARNWTRFGEHRNPCLGATLVFSRPGSSWAGHVGFYWAEDTTAYHVLGGNQSNAVTIARVSKSRLLGSRWPTGFEGPSTIVKVDSKGQVLSTNEA